jgi:hypothetical protein
MRVTVGAVLLLFLLKLLLTLPATAASALLTSVPAPLCTLSAAATTLALRFPCNVTIYQSAIRFGHHGFIMRLGLGNADCTAGRSHRRIGALQQILALALQVICERARGAELHTNAP